MIKLLILSVCASAIYSDPISTTPEPVPTSLDWRTKGAVLPVPNASDCYGDGGVVSALDAVSALIQIKTGTLVKLSQQQVYDCSILDDWCPCGPTYPTAKMIYGLNVGGFYAEEDYEYTGQCTHECRNVTSDKYVLGAYALPTGTKRNYEMNFIENLSIGPFVVHVNANSTAFTNYTGGILNDPNCTGVVDHMLLLVGYGTENGVDYWIAKNSWGVGWGEKGYIRLVRNKNMCGIGYEFIQPLLVMHVPKPE